MHLPITASCKGTPRVVRMAAQAHIQPPRCICMSSSLHSPQPTQTTAATFTPLCNLSDASDDCKVRPVTSSSPYAQILTMMSRKDRCQRMESCLKTCPKLASEANTSIIVITSPSGTSACCLRCGRRLLPVLILCLSELLRHSPNGMEPT